MRAAFSLLELVLVLAIIGIVVAVAAPRVGVAGQAARAQSLEQRVLSELLAVGESARAQGTSRSVVFSITTDEMRVYEGARGTAGTLLSTFSFSQRPYAADLTGSSVPSDPGYLTCDGFGVFSGGVKLAYSVDDVGHNMTIALPTAEGTGDSGLISDVIDTVDDTTDSVIKTVDDTLGSLLGGG